MKAMVVCNDNIVFRLHYKATKPLLLVCCILVTSKQYIGDPIDCTFGGVNDKVMDTYCWIHSTLTVPSRAFGKQIGEHIPHPGVVTPEEGDELKYHKYYTFLRCSMANRHNHFGISLDKRHSE
ncbi:Innexin inx2 [Amphibalanus amphitrite]|uniref:Innexin n=1 Tax=Amphibalanus amphitrite TaxID=1232801 RepID=A0A6A4UZH7_AMPAM|nr:Innexin inx2 [Amphibalanus amphitrite]